jgi:orotate phosphoribosyltransferase
MQDYQRAFIAYAIDCGVLRFGDFTLKSGRKSPYFFNTGLFDSGERLGRLGEFYAEALLASGQNPDILYGPAYKGIPLACATSIALSRKTGNPVPFAFNRKEAKDHGEGGIIVGTPLKGDVLILDDVITAGTSVRESVEIIRSAGARPLGVLIALDREEKGQGERTAVEEVAHTFDLRVTSIVGLGHVMTFLEEAGLKAELEAIRAYRALG